MLRAHNSLSPHKNGGTRPNAGWGTVTNCQPIYHAGTEIAIIATTALQLLI